MSEALSSILLAVRMSCEHFILVSLNIINVNLQIPPNYHATTHQSYQEPPVLSTLPMPLLNTPPPQVYTLVITPL